MRNQVNKEDLKLFLDYLTSMYNDDEMLEIRFVGIENNVVYKNVETFCKVHNLYQKKNCQVFFYKKDLHLIDRLVHYENIRENCKVCYAVNPRIKVKGEIETSGYSNMKRVHFIYFDIELKTHEKPTSFQKDLLFKFTQSAMNVLKKYNLMFPALVDSGNGYHLLYKIKPQNITDGKKRWYKDVIDKIINELENDICKIDRLVDFSRIFSLPTTLHPKLKKDVELIEISNKINPIKIKTKKKTIFANNSKNDSPITGDINEMLEYQVLLKNPPSGDLLRHTYIIFPLKIWMRDVDYKDWQEVANLASSILGRPENCNPGSVSEDATYSRGPILKYLRHHRDWAIKNGFEKYVI